MSRRPVARIEIVAENIQKDGCMRITSGVVADMTDHAHQAVLSYMEEHHLSADRVEAENTYGYEVTSARASARRRKTG